ncbi:MAG: response regulator transcription factor [Tepidisphaeraceae bacterium]|jgi:two-component system NarL family response regulator
MSIRIVLVDDHKMFRDGLCAILERDAGIQVVGTASDGRQAMAKALELEPDIVIMDIGMKNLNGVDSTRGILARNPSIKVIALSAHNDRAFVTAMLAAGASGYVLKDAASDEILRAIHAVHLGQRFLDPAIVEMALDNTACLWPNMVIPSHTLAPREREVVQLLAEGSGSKEIALRLHISVSTVETHRRNIMRKLKLHSVAELTKFAIREGLTSADGWSRQRAFVTSRIIAPGGTTQWASAVHMGRFSSG